MSGPNLICAGCGKPTGLFKPVCDDCIVLLGGVPAPVCVLCQAGFYVDPQGQHKTKDGGYAGQCSRISSAQHP